MSSTPSQYRMLDSIQPCGFSTRLQNCLIRLASSVEAIDDLENVIEAYEEDRAGLELKILRMPGAGKATQDELFEYLEQKAFKGSTLGRVTLIDKNQAQEFRSAIDRVLTRVSSDDRDYRRLRDLQEALKSSMVKIEQPDDNRPEFKKD